VSISLISLPPLIAVFLSLSIVQRPARALQQGPMVFAQLLSLCAPWPEGGGA
jgi:hypothetical protein